MAVRRVAPIQPDPAPVSLELGAALRRVSRRPELIEPVYQPIVDLGSGLVRGYELLARFPSPPLAVAPDEWFGAASGQGVGGVLEARMVGCALAQEPPLANGRFVSINLTPRAVLSPQVQAAFGEGRLDGVVVELTEKLGVSDYDVLRSSLDVLRDRGAMVAVDDAGAGYNSLRHVLELRPEFLKVDQTLVAGLDRDPARAAALEALCAYADRTNALLVAEGIERDEELDTLVRLGVPLGQGFLLGRPAAELGGVDERVAARLREHAASREESTGIGTLAERAATVQAGNDPSEFADRIAADSDCELLVLLDDRDRPRALRATDRGASGFRLTVPMCVDERSPISLVARRAMTRPAAERFDPLACCDTRGRLVGVVWVERLVEALAGASG